MTVYNGDATLFGCITEENHGTITGNCYCPVGNYHAFREGSDTDGAAAVSIVSGIPDGATVSSAATYTYGGSTYCAQNNATTITAGTNKVFSTFTATGATYSLANDKKSATVNVGTNDVTVSATIIPDPAHFAENSDGSYTIKTDIGWGLFCDALQDNATYNRFSGKTVKLDPTGNSNNITINRMAGSDGHDFCGTFDGQGNTLTFTSTENIDGVAPFSYVSETTPTGGSAVSHPAIRNLNVVADINTTATHASALVGRMWGTLTIKGCTVGGIIQTSNKYAAGVIAEQIGAASITDCVSSVTIKSSVSANGGDGSHGGLVAAVYSGNTLNITGCLFDGKLLTTSTTNRCGGFVGYNGATVNISNSLYAPTDPEPGETWVGTGGTDTDGSATFARGVAPTVTNSYYTKDFNDGEHHTAQGKAQRTVTAGDLYVTTCTVSKCTSAATLTKPDDGGGDWYGGIAGNSNGTLRHNLAIGAVVPAADDNFHGAICGENVNGTLENNYYYACKVGSADFTATGVGCGNIDGSYTTADVTDGAVPGIILYDHSSKTNINSYILTVAATVPAASATGTRVALAGRTLYKDGDWNTLCLPFDVALEGSPLEGATVMKLTASTSNLTNGTLTLNFEDETTTMAAGTPYIIKWGGDGTDNIVSPVFESVTITATTPQPVNFSGGSFMGTYESIPFTSANQSILFLGTKNTLYYPQTGTTIGSFRAYFDLGTAHARQFVLNFGFGEDTGIISTTNLTNFTNSADSWYTLDGVRLDAQPTKKGLYIHGGRKVVIK